MPTRDKIKNQLVENISKIKAIVDGKLGAGSGEGSAKDK